MFEPSRISQRKIAREENKFSYQAILEIVNQQFKSTKLNIQMYSANVQEVVEELQSPK